MKRKLRHRIGMSAALVVIMVLGGGMPTMLLIKAQRERSGAARQAYDEAAWDARRAHQEVKRKCSILPAAKQPDCHDAIIESGREHMRRELEVDAQQEIAIWNESMGDAALLGIMFSTFSLVLIFITFDRQRKDSKLAMKQAREAAESAERAVQAANKTARSAAAQVKVAQDTAYRQLRPYISVEARSDSVDSSIMSGHFLISNTGQTPARFRVFYNRYIGQFPLHGSLPDTFPDPFEHGQHSPFVNAHSHERVDWYYGHTIPNAVTEIARIIANPQTVAFYIYGRVEFGDSQKPGRRLYFAYRNHGPIVIGHAFDMIAMPFGNAYGED